ncbi:hypothetical protein C0989_011180 [Termitomyces sp. Mn162]|nr:hypothetical protein C0989_011180 [Termitomyces sp. Mn162]
MARKTRISDTDCHTSSSGDSEDELPFALRQSALQDRHTTDQSDLSGTTLNDTSTLSIEVDPSGASLFTELERYVLGFGLIYAGSDDNFGQGARLRRGVVNGRTAQERSLDIFLDATNNGRDLEPRNPVHAILIAADPSVFTSKLTHDYRQASLLKYRHVLCGQSYEEHQEMELGPLFPILLDGGHRLDLCQRRLLRPLLELRDTLLHQLENRDLSDEEMSRLELRLCATMEDLYELKWLVKVYDIKKINSSPFRGQMLAHLCANKRTHLTKELVVNRFLMLADMVNATDADRIAIVTYFLASCLDPADSMTGRIRAALSNIRFTFALTDLLRIEWYRTVGIQSWTTNQLYTWHRVALPLMTPLFEWNALCLQLLVTCRLQTFAQPFPVNITLKLRQTINDEIEAFSHLPVEERLLRLDLFDDTFFSIPSAAYSTHFMGLSHLYGADLDSLTSIMRKRFLHAWEQYQKYLFDSFEQWIARRRTEFSKDGQIKWILDRMMHRLRWIVSGQVVAGFRLPPAVKTPFLTPQFLALHCGSLTDRQEAIISVLGHFEPLVQHILRTDRKHTPTNSTCLDLVEELYRRDSREEFTPLNIRKASVAVLGVFFRHSQVALENLRVINDQGRGERPPQYIKQTLQSKDKLTRQSFKLISQIMRTVAHSGVDEVLATDWDNLRCDSSAVPTSRILLRSCFALTTSTWADETYARKGNPNGSNYFQRLAPYFFLATHTVSSMSPEKGYNQPALEGASFAHAGGVDIVHDLEKLGLNTWHRLRNHDETAPVIHAAHQLVNSSFRMSRRANVDFINTWLRDVFRRMHKSPLFSISLTIENKDIRVLKRSSRHLMDRLVKICEDELINCSRHEYLTEEGLPASLTEQDYDAIRSCITAPAYLDEICPTSAQEHEHHSATNMRRLALIEEHVHTGGATAADGKRNRVQMAQHAPDALAIQQRDNGPPSEIKIRRRTHDGMAQHAPDALAIQQRDNGPPSEIKIRRRTHEDPNKNTSLLRAGTAQGSHETDQSNSHTGTAQTHDISNVTQRSMPCVDEGTLENTDEFNETKRSGALNKQGSHTNDQSESKKNAKAHAHPAAAKEDDLSHGNKTSIQPTNAGNSKTSSLSTSLKLGPASQDPADQSNSTKPSRPYPTQASRSKYNELNDGRLTTGSRLRASNATHCEDAEVNQERLTKTARPGLDKGSRKNDAQSHGSKHSMPRVHRGTRQCDQVSERTELSTPHTDEDDDSEEAHPVIPQFKASHQEKKAVNVQRDAPLSIVVPKTAMNSHRLAQVHNASQISEESDGDESSPSTGDYHGFSVPRASDAGVIIRTSKIPIERPRSKRMRETNGMLFSNLLLQSLTQAAAMPVPEREGSPPKKPRKAVQSSKTTSKSIQKHSQKMSDTMKGKVVRRRGPLILLTALIVSLRFCLDPSAIHTMPVASLPAGSHMQMETSLCIAILKEAFFAYALYIPRATPFAPHRACEGMCNVPSVSGLVKVQNLIEGQALTELCKENTQVTANQAQNPMIPQEQSDLHVPMRLVRDPPECQIVIAPAQILPHLTAQHPLLKKYFSAERITELLLRIDGALDFVPEVGSGPIPYVQGLPVYDGLLCSQCDKVYVSLLSIKQHYSQEHRNIARPSAWPSVKAQRLNNSDRKSYFRIHAQPPPPPTMTTESIIADLRQELEASNPEPTGERLDPRLVNPWLQSTRWLELIEGHTPAELIALVDMPDHDEFPGLADAVYKLYDDGERLFSDAPELVLQRLITPDPAKTGISNKPFKRFQNHQATMRNYAACVIRLLTMLLRGSELIVYDFTELQISRSNKLLNGLSYERPEQLSMRVLHALIPIWTHTWCRSSTSPHPDPTMNCLALCSLNPDGTFKHPRYITGPIAHFEYCMRLTFLIEMHRLVQLQPRSTYQSHCEDLQSWFTEKHDSTFNALRSLQHRASTVALSTMALPNVWWLDRVHFQEMAYKGHRIHFDNVKKLFVRLEADLVALYEDHILCGLKMHVGYDNLADDLSSTRLGYSFICDPRNPFRMERDRLIRCILEDGELRSQFTSTVAVDGYPIWNTIRLRSWLRKYAEFHRLLLLRGEMLGGSPARGTELTAMTYRNIPTSSHRNLVAFGKYLAILVTYHKGTSMTGIEKLIPHALDAVTSDLIIQDLALVRPFAELASFICNPKGTDVHRLYRDHLFINDGHLFDTTDISTLMRTLSAEVMQADLTIQSWRQVCIAFRRRMCTALDDLIESDSGDTIEAMQATHSRRTENRIYGLSTDALSGVAEDVLPLYLQASTHWQIASCAVPGGLALPYFRVRASDFDELVKRGVLVLPPQSSPSNNITVLAESLIPRLTEGLQSIIDAAVARALATLSTPTTHRHLPSVTSGQHPDPLEHVTTIQGPSGATPNLHIADVTLVAPGAHGGPVAERIPLGGSTISRRLGPAGAEREEISSNESPSPRTAMQMQESTSPNQLVAAPPHSTRGVLRSNQVLPDYSSTVKPCSRPTRTEEEDRVSVGSAGTPVSNESLASVDEVCTPAGTESLASGSELERLALSGLRRALDNANATWVCEEQRLAVLAVLRREGDVCAIMRTGSGKTMLAIIPALVELNSVTVVILPLRSIMTDYHRKLHAMKIPFEYYGGEKERQLTGEHNLILVSADRARQSGWRQALEVVQTFRPIGRFVFDECHYPLVNQHFRKSLEDVNEIRTVACQLVVLSATVPLRSRPHLQALFGLVACTTIAMSTDRPELQYILDEPAPEYKTICDRVVAHLRRAMIMFAEEDRALVFVSNKDMAGIPIARELGCEFYHGGDDSNDSERVQSYQRWIQGSNKVMVCTSAFSAGNDYPHVRLVVHAGTPFEMVGYTQEVGRAGRDGRPAQCILVPRLRANETNDSPEDHKGAFAISAMIFTSNVCLRYLITVFNDGYGVFCNDSQQCSRCVSNGPVARTLPTRSDVVSIPMIAKGQVEF